MKTPESNFLKTMYGVSTYEPKYLNAIGDVFEKLNPITVTKEIISGIKDRTDALYRVSNVYIPKLKAYDESIPKKLADYELLENEVERLNADPSLVKEYSVSSDFNENSTTFNAFINHINGWINYGNSNKWWDSSATWEKIIYDCLWQTWQQLKAATNQTVPSIGLKYSTFKTTSNDSLNFEKFVNYIGQSGAFTKFKVKGSYTNLDYAERIAELKGREIQNDEADYDNTYASALVLANTYKLVEIRLDMYSNRKERKERRENRRARRKERRDARKRVNNIINELEKIHNPKELTLKTNLEKGLSMLDYYSKRNLPEEQKLFDAEIIKVEKLEVDLAALQVNKIDVLEGELKTIADKYAFAERKMEKYFRKEARKEYRYQKKQLKDFYKDLYGKGWKKESEWQVIKAAMQRKKIETIQENAGIFQKIGAVNMDILMAAPRAAFLALLAVNAFDLAGRINKIRIKDPKLYSIIETKWLRYGGKINKLNEYVEKFSKRNPLPKYGSPLGKLIYKAETQSAEGEFLYAAGASVAAEVATASDILAVIGKVIGVAKQLGVLDEADGDGITGDPNADDSVYDIAAQQNIDFVNSLDIPQEKKNELLGYLQQGFSIDEALTKAGYSTGSSINWWIVGGIALALLGTTAYLIFSGTKKGR